MRVLAENRFFALALDTERSLVRWTRTPLPLATVDEFEDIARKTVLALLPIDRGTHVLLVDLRESPMRNDEAFEQAALRFRKDVHRGFQRSAVLVKTHAGQLQIARHIKERPADAAAHQTFLDEAEALAYLLGKA